MFTLHMQQAITRNLKKTVVLMQLMLTAQELFARNYSTRWRSHTWYNDQTVTVTSETTSQSSLQSSLQSSHFFSNWLLSKTNKKTVKHTNNNNLTNQEKGSLTIICFFMVGVLEGLLQLLCLAPQADAFEHLSSTVPPLLAAVLCYHLLLDVLELLVGEVLHEHRLKHLQRISLDYKQLIFAEL